LDDVPALAEKAVRAVRDLNIPHRASSAADHVTISVGAVTCIPRREQQPLELVEAADQAMYEAKQTGRNRAVVARGP
jgi:two-component system chemotaxis family response regulator WspR